MKKILLLILPLIILSGCCSDNIVTNTEFYDKPKLLLDRPSSMKLKPYVDPKISQLTIETISHNSLEMSNYIQKLSKIIDLYQEYYETNPNNISK